MATLRSLDGATRLSLHLPGYQFPGSEKDWDKEWLVVELAVETPTHSWNGTEPCLTDFEVELLATGLRQLMLAPQNAWQLEFTEPNLSFRSHPSSVDGLALEIGFDEKYHPDCRTFSDEPFWVSMNTSAALIESFTGELEKELKAVRR